MITQSKLITDLERLSLEIVAEGQPTFMVKLVIQLTLVDRIKVAQEKNPRFVMQAQVNKEEALNFYIMSDGY